MFQTSRLASSIFRSAVSRHFIQPLRLQQQQAKFSQTVRIMAQEYRLKGLTSIELKTGQKQEAEVEGIEGGKVLLVKAQDGIHAMSPNCTHYGAPLMKGVVTGDGRITCPWHGACFKISTGDVEDAPALDPLAKFKVVQKDGGVYITGEESVIKAGRRQLSLKCSAKSQDHTVIVGGGSGGLGAVEALRGGGYTGKITMITEEPYQPIDFRRQSRVGLSDQGEGHNAHPSIARCSGEKPRKGAISSDKRHGLSGLGSAVVERRRFHLRRHLLEGYPRHRGHRAQEFAVATHRCRALRRG